MKIKLIDKKKEPKTRSKLLSLVEKKKKLRKVSSSYIPKLTTEQLEKLLIERKQKELEQKNLQEKQSQILALEQERLRLEAEKRKAEKEIRLEKEREEKERKEFLAKEILVPLIPINERVFDICPFCKMKTNKSKVRSNGNNLIQEIKCKNKLCTFRKIINLEV